MTAILSVIVATGVIIATGVGDAYTALLPAVGTARPIVFRRGQRIFLSLTVAAGVIAATTTLAEVRGSVAVGVLVALGTPCVGGVHITEFDVDRAGPRKLADGEVV